MEKIGKYRAAMSSDSVVRRPGRKNYTNRPPPPLPRMHVQTMHIRYTGLVAASFRCAYAHVVVAIIIAKLIFQTKKRKGKRFFFFYRTCVVYHVCYEIRCLAPAEVNARHKAQGRPSSHARFFQQAIRRITAPRCSETSWVFTNTRYFSSTLRCNNGPCLGFVKSWRLTGKKGFDVEKVVAIIPPRVPRHVFRKRDNIFSLFFLSRLV